MMMNKGMLLDVQEMLNGLLGLHHEYEDKTTEINRLESALLESIISSTCYFVEIRGGLHWDNPDSHFDLVVGRENAFRKAKDYCGRVWTAVLDENGEPFPTEMIHDEDW